MLRADVRTSTAFPSAPGGGYAVGRELFRHLRLGPSAGPVHARAHPGPSATRADPRRIASRERRASLAPPGTANRVSGEYSESTGLVRWATAQGVDRAVQLNGMIIPGLRVPTRAITRMPGRTARRPGAAGAMRVAYLKRRAKARALRRAACVGWTSGFADLITGSSASPRDAARSCYNGLPDEWLARAAARCPNCPAAPRTVVGQQRGSVQAAGAGDPSNARPARAAGLERLSYRVAGHCEPGYAAELTAVQPAGSGGGSACWRGGSATPACGNCTDARGRSS